jgi:DNA (cytosine-5)-methyltransferase 1
VEGEAAAIASLVTSMEAGWFHPAPIWSDMRNFDARPFRGLVDILASGDPCQGNSVAGKRLGAEDERFLAPEVVRIADECRPNIIFRENVCGNTHGQLAAIVPGLESLGYRVAAGIFSSAETGNTMRRERLFIMARARYAERPAWRKGNEYEPEASISEQPGCRSGPMARSLGHHEAWRQPATGQASGGRALSQPGGSSGALESAQRPNGRPLNHACGKSREQLLRQRRQESAIRAGATSRELGGPEHSGLQI